MKKRMLFSVLCLAGYAHAIPCPTPMALPEDARGFPTCGDVAVFERAEKFGFSDPKTGEVLVEAQFDAVLNFYVWQLTPVRKGDKWGYVNQAGEAVIPFTFDRVTRFLGEDSLAIVSQDGKWGMIDAKGEVRVPLAYDRMDGFLRAPTLGYVTVACKDGKCGYMDAQGKQVIDLLYDDAGGFGAEIAPVKQGEKWGYINEQGAVVVPFEYDRAAAFAQGRGLTRLSECVNAYKGDKLFNINDKGEAVSSERLCFDHIELP